MVKKNFLFDLTTIFLTLYVIFEIYYVPHAIEVKKMHVFPILSLNGFVFTVAEMFILLFIFINTILLIGKYFLTNKLILSTKEFVPYLIILALLFAWSIVKGILNSNTAIIYYLRLYLIPVFIYLVFLNFDLSKNTERLVVRLLLYSSIIFTILNFIGLFSKSFINFISPTVNIDTWFVLSFILFSFNVSLARNIFGKYSTKWILINFLSIVVILFHLQKPIIFAMVISFLFIVVVSMLCNKFKFTHRIFKFTIIITFLISLVIMSLPTEVKQDMQSYVEYRFLNIGRGVSEGDLSTGRFAIWKTHLDLSQNGYGLSPQGIGYIPRVLIYYTIYEPQPHNIVVLYASQLGLIAALILSIIIFKFVIKSVKYIVKIVIANNFKQNSILQPYEIIGIISYIISIVGIGMVTEVFSDYRLQWIFWLFISFIMKRWVNYVFNYEKQGSIAK